MRSTLITPTPAQQARLRSGQGGAICATAGAISERATDDGKCGRYLWLSQRADQCLHRIDEFLEDRSDSAQLLARLVRERGIFCPWIRVAPAAEGFVSPVWCGAAFVVHAQPYRKGSTALCAAEFSRLHAVISAHGD